MIFNYKKVEEQLIKELGLTEDEANVFLFIVLNGKHNIEDLSRKLAKDQDTVKYISKSLESKGMFIELDTDRYESLHPRFAITNYYRKKCLSEDKPISKNVIIDNIGMLLEKPYEDARTK